MLRAVICTFALLAATSAAAQSWPSRQIQLVVPYAPGGVVDFIGRTLGQRLAQQVGQPVVIDNRPGAGGMIGIEYTARSAPDGHTIVLMDPAVVINPVLQEKPLYDLFKDLATVAVIGHSPLVLTVNPQLPVNDVAAARAVRKSNPGKLNFASAGIGTTPHMAGELLKIRAGIDMTHVPIKAPAPPWPTLPPDRCRSASAASRARCPSSRMAGCGRSPPRARSARRRWPTCRR